jgi:3-methyladenine DNA glycosylase AlkD
MSSTADDVLDALSANQSDEELRKIRRYFKGGDGEYGAGDEFMGVRMGIVFQIAKEHAALEPSEIEVLLDSPIHEARAAAVKVMALQAAATSTAEARRSELYELYLRRHDRINNWDLVDLGAADVVGRYLFDRPRDPLYDLARSPDLWRRRTAIWSTLHFLRKGQVDDTYAIVELVLDDRRDLTHKAAGTMLRTAGVQDRARLVAFLDAHRAKLSRTTLRIATEHFDAGERARFVKGRGRASS